MGRLVLAPAAAAEISSRSPINRQSAIRNQQSIRIDLGFPGRGGYDALIVRDRAGDPAAVAVEKTTTAGEALTIELRPAGGFIARFAPNEERLTPNGERR
jgi:hypothetical protein